jgi:hypothetical protein
VLKAEEAIGVGASAGGTGSISGSAGRVDAGATVYTPGSLGGKFAWNAGVGDGKLAIGIDLGAQIGIGGLGVNIAFEIDFKGTASAIDKGLTAMGNDPVFRSVANEVASWFGISPPPPPPPAPPSAEQLAARAAAEKKIKDLEQLKTDFQAVVNQHQQVQATFLNLVKTNPKAAAEYSKSNAILEAQRQHRLLVWRAGLQGFQLAVVDGKMGLVAKK